MATPDELEDVRKNVRKILEPMVKVFPQSKHPNHAVGTSKTFRSLARLCGAVMRAPGREDAWIMTREQLEDWIPRLAARLCLASLLNARCRLWAAAWWPTRS